MFEAFETRSDPLAQKRFLASMGASLAFCGLLAATVAYIASRPVTETQREKSVDVSFRPPPPPPPVPLETPKPAPPKPKAPAPAPKSATPATAAAAPVAAPAPIIAPNEVPTERAPEASSDQAVPAIAVAVGGTGDGSGSGSVNGVPGGTGSTGTGTGRPINLPENATPAEPFDDNASPEYPVEARSAGLEGLVVLKCVIDEEGKVKVCKPMKGDEPFVSAALKVISSWRYRPALVDGVPTRHFKIVKVPFRIRS